MTMNARTVMTHAPSRGLKSVLCAQCIGFGAERPATVTANYLPEAQDAPMGAEETLCGSCASDRRVYCNVRPMPTVAPVSDAEWLVTPSVLAQGVSLVKRGLVAPGTRRVRVPEFILAKRRAANVDRAIAMGPIGVGPALERNDLRALSLTFDVMARLNH